VPVLGLQLPAVLVRVLLVVDANLGEDLANQRHGLGGQALQVLQSENLFIFVVLWLKIIIIFMIEKIVFLIF
jgi:hypothetical protein